MQGMQIKKKQQISHARAHVHAEIAQLLAKLKVNEF
jgi:hypothetical protein